MRQPTRPGRVTRSTAPPVVALRGRSPFVFGFFVAAGALLAFFLGTLLLAIGSVLILIVVAMFLAVGLNPAVEFFGHHGLKRHWAVLVVILIVLAALALFVVTLVPVISDQVNLIINNAPSWFTKLEHNHLMRQLDDRFHVVEKLQAFIQSGDFGRSVFGGVVGVGMAVLSVVANTFLVVVLTLYFLAGLPSIKGSAYSLAPASRRDRVAELGDQILRGIGGYVSGAFVVAMCAGLSTMIFLFIVGLGQYAVALAAVVALLDVIPLIGATLGAVVVCAIGFATDPKTGLICIVFYVLYQQLENYFIYPRVMSRSVDIPGLLTVIAALVGASLLGVVGALLAIPTAAGLLLLVRELLLPRQEAR
ncbi:MAG: AI-2E family transporter [Nocardioidaceae bacterium]